MTLPSQRDLFDIPDDVAYLNCSYMGPLPRSTTRVGMEAVGRKSRPWGIQPGDFFADSERIRTLFADLIGGDAEGVAIIPSVSYGMAVATLNVPVSAGENIIVLAEQFPSNVYPWRELASSTGGNLVTVPRPADNDWTNAVLDLIDEKTAVVAIPNCHWTDGSLVDLVRVGDATQSVGAAFVVDGIQSLGAYPMDVSAVRPDFLVASSYKWLLGPYGLGFMWVSEDYREGRPVEHNWINRRGSENFSALVDYRDDFQPGARRYDMGERSNPILLPMALESLRQILDWGVENISEYTGGLTDLISQRASDMGIETVQKERRVRHMIGLRLGSKTPKDLATQLAARNISVSVRGESVRVSPHLYNTEKDVDHLFAALEDLL